MKTYLKIWDENSGPGYIPEPQVQVIHRTLEAGTSSVWVVSARVGDVDYPLTQTLRGDLAEKGVEQLVRLLGVESTKTGIRIISWHRDAFSASLL